MSIFVTGGMGMDAALRDILAGLAEDGYHYAAPVVAATTAPVEPKPRQIESLYGPRAAKH